MIYNLFISKAAIYDIEQAIGWYGNQRKGLGDDLELCIEAGLRSLERDPLLCQAKYKDVRVKYIKRYPYGIHYQIESKNIKVIAFFHMKRNPLKWNELDSPLDNKD